MVNGNGKWAAAFAAVSLTAFGGSLPPPSYDGYVVAADVSTDDGDWGRVVDALRSRHKAQVVRYDGIGGLPGLLVELRKSRPKYVCFVAKPETVGRDFVAAATQAMRLIDDDPYGDAIWGIVTGYSAEDALRLATAPATRTIKSIASSMGGPSLLDPWDSGFASDEGSAERFWVKRPGGANEQVPTNGSVAKTLADAFNTMPVDYFVTSGHARERNWQIIYNQNKGTLVHTPEAGLRFLEPGGEVGYDLTNASLRVYIGAGNCLIGHVDSRACMATAWMRTAGVEQFAGYTVPSWYGFMGWGVKGLFEQGRYSLPEARFLENERLLWAQGRKPGKMHEKGLAYDRDTFALYGDPAQRIMFPKDNTPYSISVKGDKVEVEFLCDCDFKDDGNVKGASRPVMAILSAPPPGNALFGADGKAVPDSIVNERYLLFPILGHHAAGEKLSFCIGKRERSED